MSSIPQQIGKYKIVRVLGKGAMGVVYLGEDPLLKRQVAVKVIMGDEVDDEMRERFRVEARAAAALAHPNIVVVYDLGEQDGVPYIAMELLHGEDLRHLMRRRPDLPPREAVELILQVCEGLAFAHQHKIVHRDIKPANIHVCPDGRVKIVDFGVAKMESTSLTKTGMVIGTPDYMSPEQIQGKTVDTRSDIFSTGVVFYELLARQKPFSADSITSIIYNIVFKPPVRFAELQLDVPPEVERIVHMAMSKDLRDRYQTMGDMAADLRRYLAGGTTTRSATEVPASPGEATRVLTSEELQASRPGAAPSTGTLQVGESPSQRRQAEDAAATGLAGATQLAGAPRSATPTTRSRGALIGVGIAAAVILVTLVAWLATRAGKEPAGASAAPGTSTSLVPVEIVVSPWAKIDRLVKVGGAVIEMGERNTPMRLTLAPGLYRAELVNPELALSDQVEFQVRGPAPERVVHVLAGFDPAVAAARLAAP
jgi:serine/threonine-protein kinase